MLSRNLARFTSAEPPAEASMAARARLLDTIGVAIAATCEDFATTAMRSAERAFGQGPSRVLNGGRSLSSAGAALVNGVLVHGLDYDDTYTPGIIHVSTAVVPAAMAISDLVDASSDATVRAIAIGTEVSCRASRTPPSSLHEAGFHPTSIVGVFGAAAAAGVVLGLDEARMLDAFGLCGSLASGILQLEDSWLKRWHGGWAAHAGVIAALTAEAGFRGPKEPLEGDHGVFMTHVGGRPRQLDNDGAWESERVTLKRYPCCHFAHSAITCARALREPIAGGRIGQVTAYLPPLVIDQIGHPADVTRRPTNSYKAKFAMHFLIARALLTGDCGLGAYGSDALEDPATLELAERVELVEAVYPDFPHKLPARLEVRLTSGRLLEAADVGEPVYLGSNGLSLAEGKFRENLHYVGIGDELIESLIMDTTSTGGDVRQAWKTATSALPGSRSLSRPR